MIVYICLVAEYASRHRGEFHLLKNRCSECLLVGHNKQNCPATHGVGGWKKWAHDNYAGGAVEHAVEKTSDHVAENITSAAEADCSIA